MHRRLIGCTLAILLLPLAARAEILPTFSLRELAVRAPAVVIAAPDGALGGGRFKVLQTLHGKGLRVGDTLAVTGLGEYDLKPYDSVPVPGKKRKGPYVKQAVLFVHPSRDGKSAAWGLELSGVRFLSDKDRVLVPLQLVNPGPYRLEVSPHGNWAVMLLRLRADLATADQVRRARGLGRPADRNRALLEWVERHRHEFGGGLFVHVGEDRPPGWGALETEVFDWVLASCRPEECWAAVRLYAQLNHGQAPKMQGPSFGTTAGRGLLLRVALDRDTLEGDRVRALTLLADSYTLAPTTSERHPGVGPLGDKEQADMLARLPALLKTKSPALRAATARALYRITKTATGAPAKEAGGTVAALTDAYRAEPPGPARDALAEVVCALAGPKRWQELTGNPPGLFVCLRDLERQGGEVHFWLDLKGKYVVYESPVLTLERLNKKGTVAEKKQMPLPADNLPRPWAEGWDGDSYLLVQFSLAGLKPGTWRVGVQGTAGKQKDRGKWTAEPRTFVIEAPKMPTRRPGRYKGYFGKW